VSFLPFIPSAKREAEHAPLSFLITLKLSARETRTRKRFRFADQLSSRTCNGMILRYVLAIIIIIIIYARGERGEKGRYSSLDGKARWVSHMSQGEQVYRLRHGRNCRAISDWSGRSADGGMKSSRALVDIHR